MERHIIAHVDRNEKHTERNQTPEPTTLFVTSGKIIMKKTRIALLVVSILLWLVIGFAMALVVPVFEAMFADFGAKLPALTRACIWLSSVVKEYSIIYFQAFCGLLGGVSVLVASKNKWSYSLIFFASSFLAGSILISALFLPIFYLGAVAVDLK